MAMHPYDQETLEILQAHYQSTGQVLKGKDAEKFLRGIVPSGQKRKRKKEYWQTLEGGSRRMLQQDKGYMKPLAPIA